MFKPFVTAWTVDPVLNPFSLFFNNLFIKYDLPVRYIPAIDTIEIGLSKLSKKFLASDVR